MSLILLLSRKSTVRLESFRLAASHSVVSAFCNSTSTVRLASGLKSAFWRHHSANVRLLLDDRVSAALADSPFADNARIAQQASAIGFCNFMCFGATMSVIILYL